MKKIFLFVIAIILIIPNISFATSGACSSHGGVDCSSGPAYGGKVMCNDGWVNSSVSFSSAQECNTQEADILEIDYEISRIDSQISQLEISRNQAVVNQTEFLAHIGALRTDGNAQGGLNAVSQKYQSQIDLLNIDKDYLNKLKKQYKDELKQIEEQELANVYSCPLNSHTSIIDSTKCDCDSGYQLNPTKDSCIVIPIKTNDEICKTQNGIESHWDGIKKDDGTIYCKCSDGYVIGENKKCISMASRCIERYGKNIYSKGSDCFCSNGYFYDKTSDTCKKDTVKKEIAKEDLQIVPSTPNENIKSMESINWEKEIVNPEPVKKLKWYQKIFNWFKKN